MTRQGHLLFSSLDLDGDERCSRSELHRAALDQGWGWEQAALLAILDLLASAGPISRDRFMEALALIRGDPRGPYGEVLRQMPRPPLQPADLAGSLSEALLIIDPQRSFTAGTWMSSLGPEGAQEVRPIRQAFGRCAERLGASPQNAPLLLTRCPFPPGSYGWDEGLAPLIPVDAPYFIKPGNSALWPETNGLSDHLEALIDLGVQTLVMGGCTLNSCVRVSAMELQGRFGPRGLQVVVDLELCGARASNYLPSAEYGGCFGELSDSSDEEGGDRGHA